MKPPHELLHFLNESDNFLIVSHISPDADALGSSIALSMMLRANGKRTILFNKNEISSQYSFIPGTCDLLSIKNYPYIADKLYNLILVDCNDMKRAGLEGIASRHSDFNKIAVIDHHETDKAFGDIRWIVPESPATGMMIYYIIKEMGFKITEDMASCLYAAISFDTGNFRYENTTTDVFTVAADLVASGAKPHLIYSSLFEKWTTNRFKLMLDVMSSLELEEGVAIGAVTRKMFEDTHTTEDDVESFVSIPRILKGVQISVIIRETSDNYCRVSLRSKSSLDVAQIAKAFGGGGHKNAAGFRMKADLNTLRGALKNKILTFMHNR
jgi:phosphoesterase RecJ-like protein